MRPQRPGMNKPKRRPPVSLGEGLRADLAMKRRLAARQRAETDVSAALEADSEYMAEKATDRFDDRIVDGRIQRTVPNPVYPGRRATMTIPRGRRRPDHVPPPDVQQVPAQDVQPAPQPEIAAVSATPETSQKEWPLPPEFDDAFAERGTDQMPGRRRRRRRPAPPLSDPPPATHQITPEPLFPEVSVTPVEDSQAPVFEYDRAAAEAAYDQSGREGVYSRSASELSNPYDTASGREVRPKHDAYIPHESARMQQRNDAALASAQARIDTSREPNAFGERDAASEQRIDAILGIFERFTSNAVQQQKHYESLSAWRNPIQKLEAWNMLRQTRREQQRYERTYPDVYRDYRSGRKSRNLSRQTAERELARQEQKRAA